MITFNEPWTFEPSVWFPEESPFHRYERAAHNVRVSNEFRNPEGETVIAQLAWRLEIYWGSRRAGFSHKDALKDRAFELPTTFPEARCRHCKRVIDWPSERIDPPPKYCAARACQQRKKHGSPERAEAHRSRPPGQMELL